MLTVRREAVRGSARVLDVLYVVITLAFFAVAGAYVAGCDRLR